jgi:methylthioribulose-1-phosphate dehydratase
MAQSFDDLSPRAALVEIAHDLHARGWMHATAGNLSVRADAEHFWITVSGVPKGRLDESDFLLVRVTDGNVVERLRAGTKPSAETAIHRVLYQRFPDAGACLHGHSVDAALISGRAPKAAKSIRLAPIEMVKGFNIWQQNPKTDLPLFANALDVAKIAEDIHRRFAKTPPALTALVVRSHGATVWGATLQEAYNRFECLEFILAFMSRAGSRAR